MNMRIYALKLLIGGHKMVVANGSFDFGWRSKFDERWEAHLLLKKLIKVN